MRAQPLSDYWFWLEDIVPNCITAAEEPQLCFLFFIIILFPLWWLVIGVSTDQFLNALSTIANCKRELQVLCWWLNRKLVFLILECKPFSETVQIGLIFLGVLGRMWLANGTISLGSYLSIHSDEDTALFSYLSKLLFKPIVHTWPCCPELLSVINIPLISGLERFQICLNRG